jgi:peptide/nickel transport system permease protein
MGPYIVKRLLVSIPTLLGAFALIFMITRFVPGDPVLLIMQENLTQASYEAIQRQLGLDVSPWRQFWTSLTGALQGDFGQSFSNRRPVLSNIEAQLPHTVRLAAAALLVSVVVGVPMGLLAATRRNRPTDHGTMIVSLLALCAPNFWLGVVFILLFALTLGWFPSSGVGRAGDPIAMLRHLALPAMVLGLSGAGILARVTRSAMLDVLAHDYVRTARAFGFPPRTVVLRYALRNAMLPIITVTGLEAVKHLTGTVVVEVVFARAGIGRTLVQAILTRDYPQIQGVLIFFVTIAIALNLVVDLLYGFVDPRIRYE